MGRPIRSLLLISMLSFIALPTLARSSQLWSEKPTSSPTLVSNNDFSALAKNLVPAVVSIAVEQEAKVSQHRRQQDPFNYFHRFFGIPGPGQHERNPST